MNILGLVGSRRKLGNTEIMLKEALSGARQAGAEVALLRLTDLHVEECNGCMACVFKEQRCNLADDFYFLLDALDGADAIILGAPTYFLGPPGVVKTVVDRFLAVKPEQLTGKQAATIAVAGRPGWSGLVLPLLNLLPLTAGYEIVDSFVAYAPGPGEIALEEEALARARALGAALAIGAKPTQALKQPLHEAHCPVCWNNSFSIVDSGIMECPVCRTRGVVYPSTTPGGPEIWFDEASIAANRFTLPERLDHMRNWILVTKNTFQQHLREVLRARHPYQDSEIPWLKPGSR